MKKFLLTGLLFLIPSVGHCTTWFACTSGGNWSANVWTSVMADQGTCAASLGTPVAGDTATLNSSSGNITITSAAASAFLDMTGYTNTLAFGTQTLTLTTGANLGSKMTSTSGTITNSGGTITLLSTITGSFPSLKISGAQTLTASTFTWPGVLAFNIAGTVTLSNSGATWTNSGSCNTNTGPLVLNQTISGDSLTCSGGLFINSGSISSSSTATIFLTGGSWTGNACTTFLAANLTIAGNVTVSNTVCYESGTITYSSGTVTTTGSTLELSSAPTLNTSGMTWNTVIIETASTTINLTSQLNANSLNMIFNTPTIFSGAFNISVGYLVFPNNAGAGGLTFPAGQTIFVSNGITGCFGLPINGSNASVNTLKSATASSPIFLNYTGTVANEDVCGMTFTDVQTSAPIVPGIGPYLINYNGGVLTRTTGIKNFPTTSINPKSIEYYNGAV